MTAAAETTKQRHHCRNPRCRSKLKEPVDNARSAFCTVGCHHSYYRKRCLVCERDMVRKNEAQKLCGRRRCRNDYRTFAQSYDLHWYPNVSDPSKKPAKSSKTLGGISATSLSTSNVIDPPKKPAKSRCFWCDRDGRGWCWEQVSDEGRSELHLINRDGRTVVHLVQLTSGWRMLQPRLIPRPADEPDLNKAKAQALHVALASLPLDAATAARIRRENTDRQPYLSRSDAGERYARGDISTSQWRPSAHVNPADVPEIPGFLLRAMLEGRR
jgi:hypothetical protein